jgi:hypothetical protein
LDSPRRRSVIDRVVFNTASDSFQTHPAILDITYDTMTVLLERGIGFSFLTKGWIPDRFIGRPLSRSIRALCSHGNRTSAKHRKAAHRGGRC